MKKLIHLILVLFLLGACNQTPNKKSSIDRQISAEQTDTIRTETARTDTIESLLRVPTTSSDTIIYRYKSDHSKGDTTIGNFKLYCQIRPNGEFLPAKYYGDSIAYVEENTELLLDVNYKDSAILSTVLTREKLKEHLEYPEEDIQNYALFNVQNFNVDKDTLKMIVCLSIPDTDLIYLFRLSIANNGVLLVKDITSEELYTEDDDLWGYSDEQKTRDSALPNH